jgi:putative nucleotidyltransferase with HDIG domain
MYCVLLVKYWYNICMKVVSTEELINHKILPYNIYTEFGEKIFSAGETLTPGKLLQLKNTAVLFRDNEVAEKQELTAPKKQPPIMISEDNQKIIIETFDMNPSTILRNKLSVDDIDIVNYKGPINKKAKIEPQTQLKIKAFYHKIFEMLDKKPPLEMLGMFANIRDKIVQDIIFDSSEVFLSSQLKLLGEYQKCHALNTAILSGMIAKRLELSENAIYDIVLAGLLHDIGKHTLPDFLLTRTNLTSQEQKMLQEHTKIGYRIIKAEMDLPENIARVALEHHECNDGSGYPSGKSGDKINIESQIVSVCNYFDNLTSNRTNYKIKNTKEAVRVMLCQGTQKFSAKPLYTFVHMFSYNDTTNFEEMVL